MKILITADIYQKSIRVAKYAVMFTVFTFAAFFLTRNINWYELGKQDGGM